MTMTILQLIAASAFACALGGVWYVGDLTSREIFRRRLAVLAVRRIGPRDVSRIRRNRRAA